MADILDGSNSQAPSVEDLLRNPDALAVEVENMLTLLDSKGPALEMVQKEYEQIYEGLKRAIEGGGNTERKVEETVAEIAYTREQVKEHITWSSLLHYSHNHQGM